MKLFIYFAAAYGFSLTLTLLGGPGTIYRGLGLWLDRILFRKRWRVTIPEEDRGGPIKTLIHCPACTGFWVAFGMTFWLFPGLEWNWYNFETRWMHSVAASGIIWIVHVVMTKCGQYGH